MNTTLEQPTAYTSKESIPLPTNEELMTQFAPQFNLNVSRMFAGTDDMVPGVSAMTKAVFTAKGVDPKLREMVVLRVAKKLNCPYEWQANIVMAKNVGCTQAEIDAMSSDGPVSDVSPAITLICTATDELTLSGTLSDDTLTQLRQSYDDTTCRKLILVISWFNLLSRFLNACRVPLETTDKIGSGTSPI